MGGVRELVAALLACSRAGALHEAVSPPQANVVSTPEEDANRDTPLEGELQCTRDGNDPGREEGDDCGDAAEQGGSVHHVGLAHGEQDPCEETMEGKHLWHPRHRLMMSACSVREGGRGLFAAAPTTHLSVQHKDLADSFRQGLV